MLFHNLFLSLLFCTLCVNASDDYPKVKINQGEILGLYMKSSAGKTFSGFLGIPFAKPPIADLRFKPPIPTDSWDGVFEATRPHNVCPQMQEISNNPQGLGNEDCLYLNVFTPKTNLENPKTYSVMVFIHGGGFMIGSGMLYGPDDLIDYDVVYVNINYRLGALGFFTTGDEVVPGNNGLKDQLIAIKWVNENIKYFGGDPKDITLFGESAGAASVHYHMLSPRSIGLFQKGILQSGNALSLWALGDKNKVVENGKILAQALNCPTKYNSDMVKCLKTIEAHRFIEMDKIFMKWDIEPIIPFRPIIEVDHENAFICQHPIEIIQSGKFNAVRWITGSNTEEGAIRVSGLFKTPELISDLNNNFNKIISIIFNVEEQDFSGLRNFYFGNKEINNSTRYQLVDMFSDIMFNWAIKKTVLLHLKHSDQPIYFYMFGHKAFYSVSQIFGEKDTYYGTCHMDEIMLQFPTNLFFGEQRRNDFDKESAKLLNTLWTNFAKTGNPTPELNTVVQTEWEPVKSEELEYAFIERNIYMAKNLLTHRMSFWENFHVDSNNKKISDEL